jgi:hypothetical protein
VIWRPPVGVNAAPLVQPEASVRGSCEPAVDALGASPGTASAMAERARNHAGEAQRRSKSTPRAPATEN